MAQLALVATTSLYSEASQIIGTLNAAIITPFNASFAPGGSGPMSNIVIGSASSPINLVGLNAGASGSPVVLTPAGASAETNANIIVSATGTGIVGIGGTGTLITPGLVVAANSTSINALQVTGGQSGSSPIVTVGGQSGNTNPDLIITAKGTGRLALGGGSAIANAGILIIPSTTGVNQLQVTAGTSGTALLLAAAGSSADTNAAMLIVGAGSGNVVLGGNGGVLSGSLTVSTVASQVNFLQITGGTTGANGSPALAAAGSDTNINLTLSAKGTGTLRIGVSTMMTANGAVAMSTSNVCPTGTTSSTVVKWLTLLDPANAIKYQIPLWA